MNISKEKVLKDIETASAKGNCIINYTELNHEEFNELNEIISILGYYFDSDYNENDMTYDIVIRWDEDVLNLISDLNSGCINSFALYKNSVKNQIGILEAIKRIESASASGLTSIHLDRQLTYGAFELLSEADFNVECDIISWNHESDFELQLYMGNLFKNLYQNDGQFFRFFRETMLNLHSALKDEQIEILDIEIDKNKNFMITDIKTTSEISQIPAVFFDQCKNILQKMIEWENEENGGIDETLN